MLPVQTIGAQGTVNLPELFQTALLDNLADAVIATDKNFIILTWNKAAERIYGIPASVAVGASTRDVINHVYVNTTREEALAILLKHRNWKGVVKHNRQGQREILLDATVTEIISDSGDLIGYVSVNRDITEMAAMRIGMDGLEACFDQLNEAVAFIDKKGILTYANAKAHKVMRAITGKGFRLNEKFAVHYPVNRRKGIRASIAKAFAGETIAYETSYEKDARNRLYLDVRFCPLRNAYSEVNHVTVMVKNITKHKLEQAMVEKLSQNRSLFEQFMNNSGFIAWMTTADGIVRYMNKSYLQKFNVSAAYQDKHLSELFPQAVADKYLHINSELVRNKQPSVTIEDAVMPNGDHKTYKVIRFLVDSNGETLVAGWAADILDGVPLPEFSDSAK